MNRAQVGIFGASGYSGIEATRLLAAHPRVDLRFVTSDRWGGESVKQRLDMDGPTGNLRYVPVDEGVRLASSCDAVLLCTPAEASLELVRKLRLTPGGPRIIDLSGAFRLKDAAAYPTWYGFTHAEPALLSEAAYGMPELFRSHIRGATLVANPGCYATSATLALAPLLKDGLLDASALVVNAASGVTGAGRKSSEDFSFTEVADDFRAYRLMRHQHTPEVTQSLQQHSGKPLSLTFTAHLLPIKRGILCTSWAKLQPGVTAARLSESFRHAYGHEPLITLVESPEQVTVKRVVGTPRCLISFITEGDRLVVVSAIDNLVKGASGQALQNLNLVLGFEETLGLSAARSFHP